MYKASLNINRIRDGNISDSDLIRNPLSSVVRSEYNAWRRVWQNVKPVYWQDVRKIRTSTDVRFCMFQSVDDCKVARFLEWTTGSRKTRSFEKRHAGCEKREKINRRRIYDTLRINFFEATKQTACIFSKGGDGWRNRLILLRRALPWPEVQ